MRDPLIKLWPVGTIPVRHVTVEMERPVFTGPAPIAGRPQMVVSSAGGWRITYVGALARNNNLRSFRAMLARHRGRAAPIYVGPYDYPNGPVIRNGAVSPIITRFTDLTFFSDGATFTNSIADCILSAAAAKGATQISITNSATAPIAAGDYFELDGRLHIIEELTGGVATIWPELRANYAGGTALEIEDPRMLAFLDIDGDTQAMQLQYGRWGEATLPFIEAGW